MCLRDWVELLEGEFFARVLLVLIIVSRVVHMALPNAIFVAFRYHLYESFL